MKVLITSTINKEDIQQVCLGVVYDTDTEKFFNFKAKLSNAEVGMLYKGDILIGEIINNCFLNKPQHESNEVSEEENDFYHNDTKTKYILKSYIIK